MSVHLGCKREIDLWNQTPLMDKITQSKGMTLSCFIQGSKLCENKSSWGNDVPYEVGNWK